MRSPTAAPTQPRSRFTVAGDPAAPVSPAVGFLVATLVAALLWLLGIAMVITIRSAS